MNNEMKKWNYAIGDKVYLWSTKDNKVHLDFEGNELVGDIVGIDDNDVMIRSIFSPDNVITCHINNVWIIGTGPIMGEEAVEPVEDIVMTKDRFDLEEDINRAWGFTDDLELIVERIDEMDIDPRHRDELIDLLNSVKMLSELRFLKVQWTFNNLYDLKD